MAQQVIRRTVPIALVFGLGLFGLILTVVGGIFIWVSGPMQGEAEGLNEVPLLSAAVLGDSRPGTRGFIEGRVSARNPKQLDDFVAYVREIQREDCTTKDGKRTCKITWVEDQEIKAPLWLDLADGPALIANDTYKLGVGATIRESPSNYKTRFQGFVAGDQVVALGQVVGDKDQAFQADLLTAGTRASYIAGQLSTASVMFWLGAAFAVVGALALLALAAAWLWYR